MSDIYLQITETPTVVTLSAPVISGALSSTVTVANVVTVALDSNSLSALENVTVTVGAAVSISNFPSTQTIDGTVNADLNQPNFVGGNGDSLDYAVQIGYYDATAGEFRKVDSSINPLPISGTVTAYVQPQQSDDTDPSIKFIPIGYATVDGGGQIDQWTAVDQLSPLPVYFPANNPIPAGTNRIGVVTIGAGTVTIGAGTAQIGSVTASISGTVPVSGTFWQATQPASLASLPALAAGTAQIGSVTASISNSVVTFYPLQGTTVSNTNFTSTTASTTLVSAVAGREVLTVFNEGAGNLFISAGATCTTVAYQVRLSAGDYWECPAGQLSLAHVAVFATAGTARVTQVI
jgi:hypothetical protein